YGRHFRCGVLTGRNAPGKRRIRRSGQVVPRGGLHSGEGFRAGTPGRPNRRERRCAMKWLLWTVLAAILPAQPVITELQPRGAQKGRPFTLTLVGRNLGEGAKIRSTMPASFTLLTPDQPAPIPGGPMQGEGRYATFLVEPTADLAAGVYPIRVATGEGISNVQLFTIGAFPEFTEDESRPGALPNTNDSMEDAQPL